MKGRNCINVRAIMLESGLDKIVTSTQLVAHLTVQRMLRVEERSATYYEAPDSKCEQGNS